MGTTVLDAPLLLAVMRATGFPNMTKSELLHVLEQAMDDGLLLDSTWDQSHESNVHHHNSDCHDNASSHDALQSRRCKFSHDKVKEAAYNLMPESGPQRDELLLPIAKVLIQWASSVSQSAQQVQTMVPTADNSNHNQNNPTFFTNTSGNKEWMWLVAMQHLNSIPMDKVLGTSSASFEISPFVLPAIQMDRVQLAQWNFKVAEMSLQRGSFSQAIQFLHAAISYLDQEKMWDPDGQYYSLSLRLYNKLMEIEFAQGNYDATKDAIAMVLTKAASLQDKITAFHTRVHLAVETNDRNHEFGIAESLSILQHYGLKLASQPSSIDIGLEKMQLQLALQNRPLSVLGEIDMIEVKDHDSGDTMKLLSQLLHMCSLAKRPALNEVVAIRAMRWTLEKGLSRYLALVLTEYSAPLRSKVSVVLVFLY
jgi:predicted ATPase